MLHVFAFFNTTKQQSVWSAVRFGPFYTLLRPSFSIIPLVGTIYFKNCITGLMIPSGTKLTSRGIDLVVWKSNQGNQDYSKPIYCFLLIFIEHWDRKSFHNALKSLWLSNWPPNILNNISVEHVVLLFFCE